MEKSSIAIIGAGLSGILTAKHTLSEDYNLTIFEKNSCEGGIWSEVGYAWPDLTTNASKYTMNFSYFKWFQTDDLFPTKDSVISYLREIVDTYNIRNYIKFDTNVNLISQNKDNTFNINYTDNKTGQITAKIFDKVIICVGKLCKMDFSDFKIYLNKQNGCELDIIHSGQYKYPEEFKNKRVMVLGQGHSASQICSEVYKVSSRLINVFRKPHAVTSRTVYSLKYKKMVPSEYYYMYSRSERDKIKDWSLSEQIKYRNNVFSLLTKQNEAHNDLFIDKDSTIGIPFAISDEYVKDVKNKKFDIVKASISKIEGKKVFLTNGVIEEIDVLILATGYLEDLPFLEENILKSINYNPLNKKRPFDLDLSFVYNKNIKNLAFVGSLPNAVIFLTNELQAQLALQYFRNQENYERFENRIKHHKDKGFFDYSDISGYIELLAEELDILPDLEFIKKVDEELFNYVWNGPYLTEHLALKEKNYGSNVWKYNEEFIKNLNRELHEGREIKY